MNTLIHLVKISTSACTFSFKYLREQLGISEEDNQVLYYNSEHNSEV